MALSQVAAAIGATLEGEDTRFLRVVTDTRALVPGDLYVALRGERFDGHDFVSAALGLGAAAAMVDKRYPSPGGDARLLRVIDPKLALGALAAFWRHRFDLPVAAVTGSNGKTTVKEMAAAMLRAACRLAGVEQGAESAVLATRGNLNNDIGLPLTLLSLRQSHRFAVVELGMNHAGEMSYLSSLAQPDAALVNNVQRAHLGNFASLDGIARAKGEIFEGLAADGVAVVNADDPNVQLMRDLAGSRRRIEFSLDAPADVRALDYRLTPMGASIDLATPHGRLAIELHVPGEHNVRNALAAASLALAVGAPVRSIALGLADFRGVSGRLQQKAGRSGALIIDDTYNANPDSTGAALEVLARLPGDKLFVMGDMGEIGPAAEPLHREIGERALALGIDRCFTLGNASAATSAVFGQHGTHFEQFEKLVDAIRADLRPDLSVLVKGSRFMAMERVVAAIVAEPPVAGES